MRYRILAAVLLLVCANLLAPGCASTPAPPAAPTAEPLPVIPPVRLVGVSWHGEFFAQDPIDGYLVPVGHTGFARINSLTVTPDDRILCVARLDDSTPALIEIDPDTGRGTLVCAIECPPDVRALAASPSGDLYAVIVRPESPDRAALATIDPTTGVVTEIAQFDTSTLGGLEFDHDGVLYGFENLITTGAGEIRHASNVVTLRPPSWKPDPIGSLFHWPFMVQSIAFDGANLSHAATWYPSGPDHPHTTIAPFKHLDGRPYYGFDADEYVVDDAAICGIGYLHARRWYLASTAPELSESPDARPQSGPPGRLVQHTPPAIIEISDASLTTSTSPASGTRSGRLDISGTMKSGPKEAAFLFVGVSSVDRCVLGDDTDITAFWNRAASRPEPLSTAPLNLPSGNRSMFETKALGLSFRNLPPRAPDRIRTISGSIDIDVVRADPTITLDLADGAVDESVSGWWASVHGAYDQPTKTFSGSVDLVRTSATPEPPFDPRRVIRLFVQTPGWTDAQVKITGDRITTRDGLRVEFSATWNAADPAFTPAPSKVSIHFVSELERSRIPFEFHDIPLAR